ncbi:uncharacterized protein LOC119026885 isoform X2 [Acanthopagrus latus]|uniref:uncharacterized protein LOC119026885 isoform X2 n=2 Tax=Acanthopagrus latus TaxID=8177 RepID=UPI00187C7E80|nr:uncharacterized protein LOC119026885 isoform X2 [Acanthopagrus latus]
MPKEEKEETKEEMKEETKEKEEKRQTNSVSIEPPKQISQFIPADVKRDFPPRVITVPRAACRKVRHPREPEPSEEELFEFEEDLREFIALRAASKLVLPNTVQPVRRPRTAQEFQRVACLRAIKFHIDVYEMIVRRSDVSRPSVSETDSAISSISVKSDSSMYEPPSFNPLKKQSQLTEEISSCSVCEEAVKDPVPLLCGHQSCKQCVLSFRDQNSSTADYSCKKCGRRPETDQDLQSVLLEKNIKRVEMETEKLQAEKEKLEAEKETFQAEKEKFELEKRKLALEIQALELNDSYTNYDHGVVIPKTRIPYV